MNKKYYATIKLYNFTEKYSIVGETDSKKQDVINMVKDFAKRVKLECNTKNRKLYKDGKEMGEYIIDVRTFQKGV